MRSKKKLIEAEEKFAKAKPPQDGDNAWKRAIGLIREFVNENLPGTRVEAFCDETTVIRLEVPADIALPFSYDPEFQPVRISGDITFYLSLSENLSAQLERILSVVSRTHKIRDLVCFMSDRVQDGTITEDEAIKGFFGPDALWRLNKKD